ncbi:peroxisomal N(1)-acetyl-spermine/spermidine oxidase [Anabrus simplex]|uniref:peroxisomal N(1)-acetyl-spermine/spermidine oxidase n=1 Tax=Anabrus simplex TaxID=316456 RepID=UPI0034DD4A3B
MIPPCTPEPQVVIVGAGIAGLSAAQRLTQCGITNFTVLEATERPGGRIHSCWLGNVVAEMGCQWIKGACIANPVYTLAAQEGLLKPPLCRTDMGGGLFFSSDGHAIDTPISFLAANRFRQIEQQSMALFNLGCGTAHDSLLSFFNNRIEQEVLTFPLEHRYDASRVMHGMVNTIRVNCGDDLSMVSAEQFGSQIQIPGGLVTIPLGFIGVIAPMLREIPERSIRYCKPVKQIRWGSATVTGPRATVKCIDGEEFHADYVLVTVSLGVLKTQSDTLFCPELPPEKLEAITKLGYGDINKIFLEYKRPFWVWCEGAIKLAWSNDELIDRTDWVKGLCTFHEVAGSHNVIYAMVGGQEASYTEKISEEKIAEGCTNVLRRFTGDPALPYPTNVLRSKWCSDPYFCGAQSYMGLGSNVGHQCDLGQPLPGMTGGDAPTLLFAGEATTSGHYATVHGARLSGIREAERIAQLTLRYGGPPRPPEEVPC